MGRFRSDILLNSVGDIYINPLTNDLDFGPSDAQHINDAMIYTPGSSKKYPTWGVGVLRYLKSKNVQQSLPKSIRLNLEADGYSVKPEFTFKNFTILDIINNASLL